MAASTIAGSRIVVENLLQAETIRLKDNKTVIRQVANTKYQGELKQQGDTVSVEQVPNIYGVTGSTAGGTIATTTPNISDFQLTVDKVYQNGTTLKNIESVQSNLNLLSKYSDRFAFASADDEDKFIASLVTNADSSNLIGDQSPVTLSSSNTYDTITQMSQLLSQNNAFNVPFLFVTPKIKRRFKLENILGSTDLGLKGRLNGEFTNIDGFRVMETNNLPHVYTLTVDAQVTAADTMTIAGYERNGTLGGLQSRSVVWTFVAAGTAAAAGEIALGATLAATQQNIIDAVNGTGTASASTYIDVATADRDALSNAKIKAKTAFSAANGLTITGFSSINNITAFTVSETFTAGTNIFSAAAQLMFAVDNEAINFVNQMDNFKVRDLTDSFSDNILQEKAYGGAVLGENAKGISTVEVIA